MIFHNLFYTCFYSFATEQPLKAFVYTWLRGESIDRQPIFYKTTVRIKKNKNLKRPPPI